MLASIDALQWAGVITPIAAVIIGGIGLRAAFHPVITERREKEQELADRAERLENAAVLLFGHDGDPKRGIRPAKGLAERIDDIKARQEFIERVLGLDGVKPHRTILAMLEDADRERIQLRQAVDDLRRWLEREQRNK